MLAQPARRLLLLLAVLLLAGGLGDANGGGGRSRAGTTTPDASVAARAGRQAQALVASSARRMLTSASRSPGRRAQEGGGCDRSSKLWHVQPEEQPAAKGAFLFGTYHFDAASSWPHVPDNNALALASCDTLRTEIDLADAYILRNYAECMVLPGCETDRPLLKSFLAALPHRRMPRLWAQERLLADPALARPHAQRHLAARHGRRRGAATAKPARRLRALRALLGAVIRSFDDIVLVRVTRRRRSCWTTCATSSRSAHPPIPHASREPSRSVCSPGS